MTLPIPEFDAPSAVARAWPTDQWCDTHVVLAVSAGPDSVALLRAALALKGQAGGRGQLVVAHLNHLTRGAESDGDEQWLAALCEEVRLPLETARVDVRGAAAQAGQGLEEAARRARYRFLRDVAERRGARFVATGHTADDQVETILHRLLRGTGLAGLAGMPAHRPLSPSVSLVRPLLEVRRRDILAYLTRVEQDFRVDATNADLQHTRNRLRADLLPKLRQEFNPAVDEALLRLASQAAETQQVLDAEIARLAERCIQLDHGPAAPDERQAREAAAPIREPWSAEANGSARPVIARVVRIYLRPLFGAPPLIVREVAKAAWVAAGWPLQSMGFREWQQLASLACETAALSALSLPGQIDARRLDQTLELTLRGPLAAAQTGC